VGAGLSGATVARVLAESNFSITVIDQRDHIAGNAFDSENEFGIRVHHYGPHLFHTSNLKVVQWLSKFTEWIPYHHKVKALLADGRLATLPVNRETRAMVGDENILEIFFRPYTRKMWGFEFDQLAPEIARRVPIRDDLNELYFPDDQFQALPKEGYSQMTSNILSHPNITVKLSTKFAHGIESDFLHTFNSMSIDEYFDCRHGLLPYRSIKFHHFSVPIARIFPVATVNFTHDEPFTRVTEWKNLPGHGEHAGFSSLTVEEPCDFIENKMERYYPVKDINGENSRLLAKYQTLVPPNMTFIGRCGNYAYLDMHQAISNALSIAKKFLVDKV